MEKIEIVFDKKTGTAKIETSGFQGKSCTDATKFLASLGNATEDIKPKAEFYEENNDRVGVRKSLYTGD